MAYGKADLKELYYYMVLGRKYEEKIMFESKRGKLVGMYHLARNQEAIEAGIFTALAPQDYIMAYSRSHGGIFKRMDIRRYTACLMNRATGYNRGVGGDIRQFSLVGPERTFPKTGVLGGNFATAPGFAFALKMKQPGSVMVHVVGDGTTGQGSFYSGLNLSSLYKLPIVLVIENNAIGMSTPIAEVSVAEELAYHGRNFGMHCCVADGQDPVGVREVMEEALGRARNCEPCVVEFKTYRESGHYFGDPKTYIDPAWEAEMMARYPDPIASFGQKLLADGFTGGELAEIETEVQAVVDDAFEWAYAQPNVVGEELKLGERVFANTEGGML